MVGWPQSFWWAKIGHAAGLCAKPDLVWRHVVGHAPIGLLTDCSVAC